MTVRHGRYIIEGPDWKGPRPPLMVSVPVRLTRDQYETLRRSGQPMSRFMRELVARELTTNQIGGDGE